MGDLFTTREIATAIWLTVFLIWGLAIPLVRSALPRLLRSALHWKIAGVFACLALYTAGMVWLLREVGFWSVDLAKGTVLWFVFGGTAVAFRLVTQPEDKPLWRQVLNDQFKVIILFEYLVGTYTFPLAWELVLQPALAIVVVMHTVAQTRHEYTSAAKVLGWILGFAGVAILASAAVRALWDQPGVEAVRTIALAPVLSILFLPAHYLLVLGTTYGKLFTVLRSGPAKAWSFHLYTRWRLVRRLGLKPRQVALFQRRFGLRLAGLRTREELDSLLAEVDAT